VALSAVRGDAEGNAVYLQNQKRKEGESTGRPSGVNFTCTTDSVEKKNGGMTENKKKGKGEEKKEGRGIRRGRLSVTALPFLLYRHPGRGRANLAPMERGEKETHSS